jgi:hypothetical protein
MRLFLKLVLANSIFFLMREMTQKKWQKSKGENSKKGQKR